MLGLALLRFRWGEKQNRADCVYHMFLWEDNLSFARWVSSPGGFDSSDHGSALVMLPAGHPAEISEAGSYQQAPRHKQHNSRAPSPTWHQSPVRRLRQRWEYTFKSRTNSISDRDPRRGARQDTCHRTRPAAVTSSLVAYC